MRKLLQLNVCSNWGSTGRITEQIGTMAIQNGWDSYIAYGRSRRDSQLKPIKVGGKWDVYEHYAEHRFFDNEGLASRCATRTLIKDISKLKPNLIHLHNIHDHWLNYELLFEYLAISNIPVVWTQHDCWSFTGGCNYYSTRHCDNWINGCEKCIYKKNGLLPLLDRSEIHYKKKKRLFNNVPDLTLVPVSHWLEGELRKSYLADNRIRPIYNGIDVNTFKPTHSDVKEKYGVANKKMLLAVATTWEERKGLKDYIQLSDTLPQDAVLVLVGLNEEQMHSLPSNVVGIRRTHNIEELVKLYSSAEVVLNLSYEETFGLTTVEGFSCGTPGIVYNCTASPELITSETGYIVEPGDIQGVAETIKMIFERGKRDFTESCRERAVNNFDMQERCKDYINLYEELVR